MHTYHSRFIYYRGIFKFIYLQKQKFYLKHHIEISQKYMPLFLLTFEVLMYLYD